MVNEEKTFRNRINRDAKIPLYKQLYFELIKEIRSPNSNIRNYFYSEKDLIEMFGVSRITVRKALQMLEDEGYISKSQGSNAVVNDQGKYKWNLDDIVNDLTHFKDSLDTEVRSFKKIKPTKQVLEKLSLSESTKFVYEIERIRSIRDIKMARSISYLIPSIDIHKDELNNNNNFSITALLRSKGETPFYAEETLEAKNADDETSKILEIPKGTAIFFRERTTYNHMDKPLESVTSYYNSQHTKYYIKNKLL